MKEIKIEENVNLAPYTTMEIGGRARFFVRAGCEDDVIAGVRFAADERLPLFVLGGGSNVVIADQGFDGLVLQIALKGIDDFKFQISNFKFDDDPEPESVTTRSKLITAAGGEDWDGFVAHCVKNKLAGVECLSGIPGLVGGTPIQNVGAYGQDVSETIVSVRALDRRTDEIRALSNAECGFTYRSSIFNSTERERYIVLAVTYALKQNGEAKIEYNDLVEHFAGRVPTLAETRDAVLDIRRATSMVIDAADPNSKSVGSFFKNPIVSDAQFLAIAERFGEIPGFPFGDFHKKIPAAWLIEHAGFHKGYTLGQAGISANHTLAIVNHGGTAADILALKDVITSKVAEVFDVDLVPEPVFVGF